MTFYCDLLNDGCRNLINAIDSTLGPSRPKMIEIAHQYSFQHYCKINFASNLVCIRRHLCLRDLNSHSEFLADFRGFAFGVHEISPNSFR